MASVVSNLSSTISRLTLLRRPSLPFSVKTLHAFKAHRKFGRPKSPFLRASDNYAAAHFSSCPKSQTINSLGQDEELVVLGIETSCDDTAAAVVSVVCVSEFLFFFSNYFVGCDYFVD